MGTGSLPRHRAAVGRRRARSTTSSGTARIMPRGWPQKGCPSRAARADRHALRRDADRERRQHRCRLWSMMEAVPASSFAAYRRCPDGRSSCRSKCAAGRVSRPPTRAWPRPVDRSGHLSRCRRGCVGSRFGEVRFGRLLRRGPRSARPADLPSPRSAADAPARSGWQKAFLREPPVDPRRSERSGRGAGGSAGRTGCAGRGRWGLP